METFFPNSLEEALQLSGEYRAGGTDVQARQVLGIRTEGVVDLSLIEGLASVRLDADKYCRLGSMIRLSELATHKLISDQYSLLAEAAGKLATPQIRNRSTLGGSLLQRTRCPYFRQVGFDCLKKGDDACSMRRSDEPLPVCIDLGPCAFPHPATLGMVLLAFDARVELHNGEELSIGDLYGDGADPGQEHQLQRGQIMVGVCLPPAWENEKSAYFRLMHREASEWPVIECACRLLADGDVIQKARIAVGAVANTPVRLMAAERLLVGKTISLELLQEAAAVALDMHSADDQHYKAKLLPGVVLETLSRACGLHVG